MGFSDARLAKLDRLEAKTRSRALRHALGVRPVFKRIDTCAAEFAALTPYMYSTYETPVGGRRGMRSRPTGRKKIIILGGGPNRIGQGIEFDYCCCHAAFALKERGFETIMVNCNPGDRVDRLRHLRPALFRAAHRRGRAGDHRQASRRTGTLRGRDRAVRRPDAAQARQHAGQGRRADPRHHARTPSIWPRTASASRCCSTNSASSSRATRTAMTAEEARRGRRAPSAIRSSCAPPTCWADAAW